MNEKSRRYLINDVHLAFLAMGIFHLMPGTELPLIRSDYHLTYQTGGIMLSMQSVGVLIGGMAAGFPAKHFGAKRTYLTFEVIGFSGLILTVLTGMPAFLILAMICLGLSKGSSTYFGNQMVNNISDGDASLQNLIQAMFAAGACAAPLIALICGASWKTAYLITAGIVFVSILHTSRVEIGPDVYRAVGETENHTGTNHAAFGFLKSRLFWFCTVIMFAYMSVETTVIGWLVTYMIDYGNVTRSFAQMVVTILWAVLLAGRFLCAAAAKRFAPWQMVAVMSAGITLFFTWMMTGHGTAVLTMSALGLGFFMSGMYGTIVAGTGTLMKDYPMCMGVMIALPGIGPIVIPSIIGRIADHSGIHTGMLFLYVILVMMLAATAGYVMYVKREEKR